MNIYTVIFWNDKGTNIHGKYYGTKELQGVFSTIEGAQNAVVELQSIYDKKGIKEGYFFYQEWQVNTIGGLLHDFERVDSQSIVSVPAPIDTLVYVLNVYGEFSLGIPSIRGIYTTFSDAFIAKNAQPISLQGDFSVEVWYFDTIDGRV